jgi:hypothetical protein
MIIDGHILSGDFQIIPDKLYIEKPYCIIRIMTFCLSSFQMKYLLINQLKHVY